MALGTLGTAATTTLLALNWNPMSLVADVATIGQNIKAQGGTGVISPGGFSKGGRLHFPGRLGFLLLKPGDYVATDSWGWPIVVSKESIASGSSWVHS